MTRLRRAEQAAQNRDHLLEAAREVFLAQGFHGASLDQIAEAAGFSKGAVYSQFGSKAELFLTLLEHRIDERRVENELLVDEGPSDGAMARLTQRWAKRDVEDQSWTLLLLEFRVHAARDPELRRRYATLHRRTVEALETLLASILGPGTDVPIRHAAELLLAIGSGRALEVLANPKALPAKSMDALVQRALSTAVPQGGRS